MTENATPSGEIIVHVFGRTDVGRTREHNEDSFIVADLTTMNATLQPEVREHRVGQRGSLFMVADGMGGAAAGEIASAMATEVVLNELDQRWRNAPDATPETFARALKSATETANARIHRYASEHPENRGMGTTATIAGILGDTLYLAQVGDSRGYLIRNGVARQITKDQSLMQKLVEAGEMTAEEAEVSERRNIILQALGPEPIVKVDLTSQQVRRGDTLVLCSDGMSGQMRATDIARVVSETPDLVEACKKLIDLANENGGPDNITVIAARFDGEALSDPADGEEPQHQVYASESDARATVPVHASTIDEFAPDTRADPEAITDEVPAVNGAPGAGEDAQGAAVPVVPEGMGATPPARSANPASGAPGERVPIGVLRLIFGAIAAIVAIYFILAALRKN
ncbi:MAG TPA: Stp1/IreP family PP2C-type Ser/Thr phosphatase [Gemmatimonadaceae bacterium]|nr:Stp1/IreP family PP2C-type Ser/Thr phosphatase [Gemmatimonadaceae bacterium]